MLWWDLYLIWSMRKIHPDTENTVGGSRPKLESQQFQEFNKERC